MQALRGSPSLQPSPALPSPPRNAPVRIDPIDAAKDELVKALFDGFDGKDAKTPLEIADAQRAARDDASELLDCVWGPAADFTGLGVELHRLPVEAWSAMQHYTQATDGVGIRQVDVGRNVDFSDANLQRGLAQLDLQSFRSQTPISRAMAQQLFAVLPRLDTLHCLESGESGESGHILTFNRHDFQTCPKVARRQVRSAWAALDDEANRKPGSVSSTAAAVQRVLTYSSYVRWSEIETGLQTLLFHAASSGNEEVVRGIAQGVQISLHLTLDADRKLPILTGGPLLPRASSPHTSRRPAPTSAGAPFVSALSAKRAADASKRAHEGKVFVPSLGAFVEHPAECFDDPGEAADRHDESRAIRAPMLHALIADSSEHAERGRALIQRYIAIGALLDEIVRLPFGTGERGAAVAGLHPESGVPKTWAQTAMSHGHAGAVGRAMVTIMRAPLPQDEQGWYLNELQVTPAEVAAALTQATWRASELGWAMRLIGHMEAAGVVARTAAAPETLTEEAMRVRSTPG